MAARAMSRSIFAVLSLALLPSRALSAWPQDPNVNVALTASHTNPINPTIISDGSGGAIAVWSDNGNHGAQRVDAAGVVQWTGGVGLLNGNQCAMIADGSGGAIVTFDDGADIWVQRLSAVGVTSYPIALCTAPGNQVNPVIVSDGSGGAIVAWADRRSVTKVDTYAQRIDASGVPQWTANGVALGPAAGSQRLPTIVSDGSGGAIVAWEDQRSGSRDIYAQRINAAGEPQWGDNDVALCTAVGNQWTPKVVPDGSGGAIVVWWDNRANVEYDIYAQRVDLSGVTQWNTNGVAVCSAPKDQWLPTIASDGSGGAIVAWQDARDTTAFVLPKVYAQRIGAAGSPLWTTDGILIAPNVPLSGPPTQEVILAIADGVGGAIINWYGGPAEAVGLYAQRVDGAGAQLWNTQGAALTTAYPGIQRTAAMVTDGAGGAIAVWSDWRNGGGPLETGWDIYAQRINAFGNLGEPPLDVPGTRPSALALERPSPNPALRSTMLRYALPRESRVTLAIYDANGRRVRGLVSDIESAGRHEMVWDLRDDRGRAVGPGLYFERLDAGGCTLTQRVVAIQ